MSVIIVNDGATMTAYISGEIDHHSAGPMRDYIDSAIERSRPGKLKLNFTKVSFMDSSGVGLVMGRYKTAKRFGGETELVNLSNTAERIMKLSGLQRIITIKRE